MSPYSFSSTRYFAKLRQIARMCFWFAILMDRRREHARGLTMFKHKEDQWCKQYVRFTTVGWNVMWELAKTLSLRRNEPLSKQFLSQSKNEGSANGFNTALVLYYTDMLTIFLLWYVLVVFVACCF